MTQLMCLWKGRRDPHMRRNTTRKNLKYLWQNFGLSLSYNLQCPSCSGPHLQGRLIQSGRMKVIKGRGVYLKDFCFCPVYMGHCCFLYGTPMSGDALVATFLANLIVQNKANPGRAQSLWSSPILHQAWTDGCHYQDCVDPPQCSVTIIFAFFFCLPEAQRRVKVFLL